MGLVAPWHVGSSRTRAQTHVACIGRWILNHCATSHVSMPVLFKNFFIEIQLIYNVVLVSDALQCDSVIHIYIYSFLEFFLKRVVLFPL